MTKKTLKLGYFNWIKTYNIFDLGKLVEAYFRIKCQMQYLENCNINRKTIKCTCILVIKVHAKTQIFIPVHKNLNDKEAKKGFKC